MGGYLEKRLTSSLENIKKLLKEASSKNKNQQAARSTTRLIEIMLSNLEISRNQKETTQVKKLLDSTKQVVLSEKKSLIGEDFITIHSRYVLDRIAKLYAPGLEASDRRGIAEFLAAWRDCEGDFNHHQPAKNEAERDLLAGRLANRSAAHRSIAEADHGCPDRRPSRPVPAPMMDWIRTDVRQGSGKAVGVDVVGTTSLLVRDRTLAETSGAAEAFTKFTPIKPLTEGLFTEAQTLAQEEQLKINRL